MNARKIPIGAGVRFYLPGRLVLGRVLLDRGPIGNGGRHLYLVRYEMGKGHWYSTELPAEEIEEVVSKPPNPRKMHEVKYITPYQSVESVNAHSLFAKPFHAQPLAEFLRAQGLRVTEDAGAIRGMINLLIDSSTPWEEFVSLVNEWKCQYAGGTVPALAGVSSRD